MVPPARIHRGFHRVGVVLAAPALLVAAGLGVHETLHPSGHLARGRDGTGYYPGDYLVPVLVAVFAVALYAAARAVGWVLSGFLSPKP